MEICIAICDDEHRQTQYINMLVNKWADEYNIKIKTYMFDSAENFKSAWNENKIYEILLLDIQMGGQSGIELAKELRDSCNTGNKLIIIFITAMPDFANIGYDVSAMHYLMKPVDEVKLFEVLSRAMKSISKSPTALLLPIEKEDGYARISVGDIIYIESSAHFSEVTTTNGTFKIKMPISELERQLINPTSIEVNFVRCHRSYIVGLKYVDKITKTDIILDNGTAIPLSRRLYHEVNQSLIKYFKSGGQ